MPIPRNLNQDFFKKWSPAMAYVLGFFAADGNMIRNKRGAHFIAFYNCELSILRYVRLALGSNHKIAKRKLKPKHTQCYQLQIGCKEIFNDLLALGMSPAKSKTILFPKIPNRYVADFIRGYFDGDGCVYLRHLKFADRKRKRWIFLTLFTSGSKTFLEQLHTVLKKRGIQGGSIRIKRRGFDLSLSMRDSLALFRLMYDTRPATGLFLPRKYSIFQRAIKILYPDAAVV